MKKFKGYKGWSWAIEINGEYELCYWIRKNKKALLAERKPSPEAKIVRVYVEHKPVGGGSGGKSE